MKIASIVYKLPTFSETFVLNQIVGLIERGCEVDIYAESNDGLMNILTIKNIVF